MYRKKDPSNTEFPDLHFALACVCPRQLQVRSISFNTVDHRLRSQTPITEQTNCGQAEPSRQHAENEFFKCISTINIYLASTYTRVLFLQINSCDECSEWTLTPSIYLVTLEGILLTYRLHMIHMHSRRKNRKTIKN